MPLQTSGLCSSAEAARCKSTGGHCTVQYVSDVTVAAYKLGLVDANISSC